MARRLVSAKIKFISLCARGMNDLRTIYKAADGKPGEGAITFRPIVKELAQFEERGLIAACVYPPNTVDLEGEWAGPSDIEKMAHDYLLDGGKLDINHNEKPLPVEKAGIVESFIIQKGDQRFADMRNGKNEVVDVTGGWGIIVKVNDAELRADYRSGKWGGVSMGGFAIVKDEDPPSRTHKGADMSGLTKEELVAALKEDRGALVADLVKALKPETAAPVGKSKDKDDASKDDDVEIDLNDPEAVEKRAAELEFARIDKKDPAALRKHAEKLRKAAEAAKKTAKSKDDEGDDEGDDDSEELKKAKHALAEAQEAVAKARRASRQSDDDEGDEGDDDANEGEPTKKSKDAPRVVGLSKADQKLFERGRAFGKSLNAARGYVARPEADTRRN